MNKQILLSIFSIFVVAGMVGATTLAFFSDQGTSSGNTFSTGTLDLKLSDSDQTDQDSVTASFGSSTLVPGACTGAQTLNLKNSGSIAADHAEVHLANTVTDTGNDATPDIDAFLRIQTLTFDGGSVLGQITNSNGNGFVDLDDWEASATALDSLALTNLATDHPLVMDVCLDSTAGNTLQGDSVSATFTVDLNQDSSQ